MSRVDASGLVTAAGNGTATITASAGSASGSAVVTVTQSVVSVAVSPSATELTAWGETVQLAAEAIDENGHAVAGAEFSWESSDAGVATVDASGLVTGVAEGVATITASAGSASGSAVATVMQPVASVVVAPPKATITALGDTLRLAALAFDENGHAVAGAEFSWASGDNSVATVDAGGLVTAVAEGTATITASAGAASGAAEITVTATDGAALIALYAATDGPNWADAENWLTDAPLGDWHGVETDGRGRVTELSLRRNDLTGPIPPELGDLTSLTGLYLSGNSDMAGILPTELTGIGRLETLLAVGTDLCAPSDPGFQAWLGAIYRLRVPTCASDSTSFAYLTQAVQSREYPVPLVAGEKALLRVFVTATSPTTTGIPPVRARFYVDGTEIHVADIPARTVAILTEVYEGDLSRSSNAEIHGETVRPGLEMVVEIDPEGTLDPSLGVARRIPETGRLAVDVREMPVFDLTVIPFLWSADPHWAVVETAEAMEADPEGHELLWKTHTLLPIGDLEMTAHAPVLTSSSPDDFHSPFDQTEAIRAIEGGSGHYMGTMSNPGRVGVAGSAEHPGRVSISRLNPTTMAHVSQSSGLGHPVQDRRGKPASRIREPDLRGVKWGMRGDVPRVPA